MLPARTSFMLVQTAHRSLTCSTTLCVGRTRADRAVRNIGSFEGSPSHLKCLLRAVIRQDINLTRTEVSGAAIASITGEAWHRSNVHLHAAR